MSGEDTAQPGSLVENSALTDTIAVNLLNSSPNIVPQQNAAAPEQQQQLSKLAEEENPIPNPAIQTLQVLTNPTQPVTEADDPPPALVSVSSVKSIPLSTLISMPPASLTPALAFNPSSYSTTLVSYPSPTPTVTSPATVTTPTSTIEEVNTAQTQALVTVGTISTSIPTITAIPVPQASLYASATTTSTTTQAESVQAIPQLVAAPLSSIQVTPITEQATTDQAPLTASQLSSQFQSQLQTLQAELQIAATQPTSNINQIIYSQGQTTNPSNSSPKVGKGRNIFLITHITVGSRYYDFTVER